MILVLARARRPARNVKRYSAAAEFFKRRPKEVTRNKLLAQACEFLKACPLRR
jgi:hypothetical protein